MYVYLGFYVTFNWLKAKMLPVGFFALNMFFTNEAFDCTLVYFILIFGQNFSYTQGKRGSCYSFFCPVSAIYVTEILKTFSGFVLAFKLGTRLQHTQLQSLQRINGQLFILTI